MAQRKAGFPAPSAGKADGCREELAQAAAKHPQGAGIRRLHTLLAPRLHLLSCRVSLRDESVTAHPTLELG